MPVYSLLKFILRPLLVLSLAILVGCQKSKHTSGGGENTGDGGGGSGTQSKMYEQYIRSVSDMPAVTEGLKPILTKLSPEGEEGPLPKAIQSVLKRKNWYFVPQELSHIAAKKMGLPYKTEGFDQYAIQYPEEVWIDQNKFQQLPLESQTYLILHEALIDLYARSKVVQLNALNPKKVRTYQTSFCKGGLSSFPARVETFSEFCKFGHRLKKGEQYFSILTEEDYPNIRKATDILAKQNDNFTIVNYYKELIALGFDKKIIGTLLAESTRSREDFDRHVKSIHTFLTANTQKECLVNYNESCTFTSTVADGRLVIKLSSATSTQDFYLPYKGMAGKATKDLIDETITFTFAFRGTVPVEKNLDTLVGGVAVMTFDKWMGIKEITFRDTFLNFSSSNWSVLFDTITPEGFDFGQGS